MTESTTPTRKLAAAALLLLGFLGYIKLAIQFPIHHLSEIRPVKHALEIVALLAILFAAPSIHRPIGRLLDWMREPTPLIRRLLTLSIWLIATAYLYWTAVHQGRDFAFKTQDEFMYLVQVQAVAHGHLWMPQHPLADFFQEFYVFVRPVTSSMYFPGMALMFAPAVGLHVQFSVWEILICGAVVGMTFRVVTGLIDAVAGLLAAFLMLSLSNFRTLSLLTYSYMPMALLGLLLFWAYLHWRTNRTWLWSAILGLILGWMAITRPLDAIVFGSTLAAAMLWDLIHLPKDIRLAKSAYTILLAALCTIPFLSLQLALDKAVTGHILKTPVQQYEDEFWPGTVGGFHPHVLPGPHPLATSLPQFQDDYEHFTLPHYRGKTRPLFAIHLAQMQYSLPNYLTFIFIPLGILGLRTPPRVAFWIILPLFGFAYIAWVMFIINYAIVIAPVVMFAVVLGAHELAQTFPRASFFLTVWTSASIAALAAVAFPEFGRDDRTSGSSAMTVFNHDAESIQKPAIVFFRYHTEVPNLWKSEQTYNAEAAWFDDEPIIRAHDLGARDTELLNYYAKIQPAREVYLFDQASEELTDLGNVADLAANPQPMFEKMKAAATQPTTHPAYAPPLPHHRRK